MADDLQHQITIGPSPRAAAEVQAALIRGDIETGQTQLPGKHVVYEDKPGPDQSLSPPQLNADGKGSCASIPRAVAPFVDASHVAVAVVPQKDGGVEHHTFLVAEAQPGDAPIQIGPDGRATSEIDPKRILDPNVGHGANGGEPLPPELYQGAALAKIHKPDAPDLSHVHADPAGRAAEGNQHQGVPRLHTAKTEAGAIVAEASNLAARVVDPHPAAEPRPVPELYPAEPPPEHAGTAAERKAAAGWAPHARMVGQLVHGLKKVAAGENPAPLAGDPAVTPEHQAAAGKLLDHLATVAQADPTTRAGGQPLPAAVVADAKAKLTETAERLKTADRTEPHHDEHAAVVAEIEAHLPGLTPDHVVAALPRPGEAPTEAPAEEEAEAYDPFAERGGNEPAYDPFGGFDAVPLMSTGRDRGGSLAVSVAVGTALSYMHHLHRRLHALRVGCPGDGHRCDRPVRRVTDPRIGGWGERGRHEGMGRREELRRDEHRERGRGRTTLATGGNVYAGPNDSGQSIGYLAAGSPVEVLGHGRGMGGGQMHEWVRVRSGGTVGWVWKELLAGDPHVGGWGERWRGLERREHRRHEDERRHHWRDRWGRERFEPVVEEEFVAELGDVQLGGFRNFRGLRGGFVGGDRYLLGNRAVRLQQAVTAYKINPAVRAQLLAGGTYLGIGLASVQAAMATLDIPMLGVGDPQLGGHGGGGHGGGGGFHGGGHGQGFGGLGGGFVTADDGDVDPSNFDALDPQLGGPGPDPSSGAPSKAAGPPPGGAAPSPSKAAGPPPGGAAPSPSKAAGPPPGGAAPSPSKAAGPPPGGAAPEAPAPSAKVPPLLRRSGGSPSFARPGSGAPRPEERREERREERPRPLALSHWRDRFGKDRVGPIVIAEWGGGTERRHWRDRFGKLRFEPVIISEFVEEVEAPEVVGPAADVEVDASPRETWLQHWLHEPHWWSGRRHHWLNRDVRVGGTGAADDDEPSRKQARRIACAC